MDKNWQKKVFTHPHFMFVNYWHLATPVAGWSLKLLQQNILDSLLFSTRFPYYNVARNTRDIKVHYFDGLNI